jgi:hypothetical protein
MDESAVQQRISLGDESRVQAALQDLADDLGGFSPVWSLDIRTASHGRQ